MKRSLRVLSVGLRDSLDMAYGALLLGGPWEITRILHHGELDSVQASDGYDVALLGEAPSKQRLIDTARVIRRQWPQAKIFAVCGRPLDIDDALYDDCVSPDYSAKMLVAEVLRLAAAHGRQCTRTKVWEC